jgi:hypothetical protein
MEWDGKVAAASFTCTATGRVLVPGEVFFSGLETAGAGFARRDFSGEAWTRIDPTTFLSWWRQKVPSAEGGRRQVKLDKDLLLKLFTDLRASRERPQQCLCYVIALCLTRARAFTLQQVVEHDGDQWLLLDHRVDGLRLRLRDPQMTPQETERVQASLLDIIGVGEPG